MKLTVAKRVYGGFLAVTVLLFVIGVSSLVSLNKIGSKSEQLSTIALPTVAGSSDLKASFINMGRLTLEGFISQKESEVVAKQLKNCV